MKVLDHLINSLRGAAVYNPEHLVAPACVLWPDPDGQWESCIPLLKLHLPELLILGDIAPKERQGPSIWLRCVLGAMVKEVDIPVDMVPIIYLPGVSRQTLRDVKSCPDHLKPLVELQFRGAIWSQQNSRDWTILAYFKSEHGGLGLDVAADQDTKNALQMAVLKLLDEDVSQLLGKRLDKDFFHTVLNGNDPIRELLQWLNHAEAFQASRTENEWKAFVAVCKSRFQYSPDSEGILEGASRLAQNLGVWQAVWERYCEAPSRYPNIPTQIKKCQPPNKTMAWHHGIEMHAGWPQWNEDQERLLQKDLLSLQKLALNDARNKIEKLERQHGPRRTLVWSELGYSPLAQALEYLTVMAEGTKNCLTAGSIDEVVKVYTNHAWVVDDSVLRALALAHDNSVLNAVTTAIRSVYLPWLEDAARYLQKLVFDQGNPSVDSLPMVDQNLQEGDCVLFVDGLRYDTGRRLKDQLTNTGFMVEEVSVWAALPSVTATGKAAVSPVRGLLRGDDQCYDFEPVVAETGQSLKGGYHHKRLLMDGGFTILDRSNSGNGVGKAWCEFGDIDHEGHARGWKLAIHLDGLILEIRNRIDELLQAGWKRVLVVTDHGWLLMPEGLPKIELPSSLTDSKWGRCAAIKPGAKSEEKLYPWYWNPSQSFALADGISCYKRGEEYAHGGLSLQECLTPSLVVLQSQSPIGTTRVEITDIAWKGQRCTVVVEGSFENLVLDIRTQPGLAESSIVLGAKPIRDNGTASVVVENEDLAGQSAVLVLLDDRGALVSQVTTVIGGQLK